MLQLPELHEAWTCDGTVPGETRSIVITLEVRKGNYAAMEFYRRFNLEPVDVIRGYYNDGEDAYQMQLFI